LAQRGAELYLVGRDPEKLAQAAAEAGKFSKTEVVQADLTVEAELNMLAERLQKQADRVDILIHSAGVARNNRMEDAAIEDFDLQYAVNVRAPYRLTQRLLPLLTLARGQVVFINSSAGLAARRPDVGQYSATKHALKAVADSLREEVNPRGIRVLTVYPGRTATPMQETVTRWEGAQYRPERLLQPKDLAEMVVHCLLLPATAEVTDISIRPTLKS
jgi:NADP-dependent 3-hydroxy acid dehydrogenase YdfG